MSVDGKKTDSLKDDDEKLGLFNRDQIPEIFKDAPKSCFGRYELKNALEILDKFDVEDIDVILVKDGPILFIPVNRKMGLGLAPRRRS